MAAFRKIISSAFLVNRIFIQAFNSFYFLSEAIKLIFQPNKYNTRTKENTIQSLLWRKKKIMFRIVIKTQQARIGTKQTSQNCQSDCTAIKVRIAQKCGPQFGLSNCRFLQKHLRSTICIVWEVTDAIQCVKSIYYDKFQQLFHLFHNLLYYCMPPILLNI